MEPESSTQLRSETFRLRETDEPTCQVRISVSRAFRLLPPSRPLHRIEPELNSRPELQACKGPESASLHQVPHSTTIRCKMTINIMRDGHDVEDSFLERFSRQPPL